MHKNAHFIALKGDAGDPVRAPAKNAAGDPARKLGVCGRKLGDPERKLCADDADSIGDSPRWKDDRVGVCGDSSASDGNSDENSETSMLDEHVERVRRWRLPDEGRFCEPLPIFRDGVTERCEDGLLVSLSDADGEMTGDPDRPCRGASEIGVRVSEGTCGGPNSSSRRLCKRLFCDRDRVIGALRCSAHCSVMAIKLASGG